MSPGLPEQAQNKGLSQKALINVLVKRRGLGGQGAEGTKQPCVHGAASRERWDLLSRVDVRGAPPEKRTRIVMQARLGLHTHPDSSGQMLSKAVFDKAPSHRAGKSCTTE